MSGTRRIWSGLGFSSCAAPFSTSKAQFQEGETGDPDGVRNESETRVVRILVDIQTELYEGYKVFFILRYE
jgi:hypothetical protein